MLFLDSFLEFRRESIFDSLVAACANTFLLLAKMERSLDCDEIGRRWRQAERNVPAQAAIGKIKTFMFQKICDPI
jgi:hypothetical protein